jgi:methylmalonyl-CoA mutase cobalamin-binding subunit
MADYGQDWGGLFREGPSRYSDRKQMQASGIDSGRTGIDREQLEAAIRFHVLGRVAHLHQQAAVGESAASAYEQPCETIYFRTLLGALLERDPVYFRAMLEQLEIAQAPLIAVCQTLVMPISEELGRMWIDDRETFATISVASARLQLLVNHIAGASNSNSARTSPDRRRKILLARMPGDDHTLGLTVIAGCFTQEGWDVDGGADLEAGDASIAMIANGVYSVFGVSVGSSARLEDVRSVISKANRLRKRKQFKIGVGGPAVAGHVRDFLEMGADFAACDARQALSCAEEAVR